MIYLKITSFKNKGDNIELMPNGFIRVDKSRPDLIEIGLRARYERKYWIGMSYRNDNTLIGMLGLLIKDKVRIGYSYEYKTFDYRCFRWHP